jgi:hypothetical protein
MEHPKLEVADILRRYGGAYRETNGPSLSTAQRRVMSAIELCRTAALGGHLEQSDRCEHRRVFYNSCRDRHCPKCQSLARAEWIEDRQTELLNCEYFHVVFTVPEAISSIAYQNKEVVYGLLFRAMANTLQTIAADPKHLGAAIRRFLLHVLPNRFHRIRYYGLLGNRYRQQRLAQCRQLLGMPPFDETTQGKVPPKDYRDRYEELTGSSLRECPVCHQGHMIPVGVLEPLGAYPDRRDTS